MNKTNSIKNILPLLLISRLILLLLIFFGRGLIPFSFENYRASYRYREHSEIELRKYEVQDGLSLILSVGDGQWYIDIAENGYFSGPGEADTESPVEPEAAPGLRKIVFYPLYPMFIRLVNILTSSSEISGI
ncbi:MAG: hypothetical protein KAS39_01155, partial [Actinomycetia bacterium]|nr:hypothetical protein [Actinomycetes bacterium]